MYEVAGVVRRQVLYSGEINESQRPGWCRAIEVPGGLRTNRALPQQRRRQGPVPAGPSSKEEGMDERDAPQSASTAEEARIGEVPAVFANKVFVSPAAA